MKEEIEKGNFREDLFHRLNVIPIHIPPLKERTEDIQIRVEQFASDITAKHKKASVKFSEDAIKFLQSLQWSGNVRELRNAVERIIIIVDKKEISRHDIEFLYSTSKNSIGDFTIPHPKADEKYDGSDSEPRIKFDGNPTTNIMVLSTAK